jgi:hypothetical protein
MLEARLGRRRIIFSDAERRLLARHAKAVGRKDLFELDPIVWVANSQSSGNRGLEQSAAMLPPSVAIK